MTYETTVLEIEYEMNEDIYRRAWFHSLRKDLPSTLAFWGTLILLGLWAMFYYRDSAREFAFFALIVGIIIAVLLFIYISSYQGYMRDLKRESGHSGKNVRLIFKADSDGFDCINGKNFSHIAWETITSYEESDEYIILGLPRNFYIPKSAFRNDAELSFVKSLVQIKSLALRGK